MTPQEQAEYDALKAECDRLLALILSQEQSRASVEEWSATKTAELETLYRERDYYAAKERVTKLKLKLACLSGATFPYAYRAVERELRELEESLK